MTAPGALLRHFDKALFAGIATWLLQAGVSSALPLPELATSTATRAKLEAIAVQVADEPSLRVEAPRWGERLRDRLDPGRVPPVEARSFPAWLAWRRPNLVFVAHVPWPGKPVPVVKAPVALQGVVEPGRVRLSWQLDPDNAHVLIDGFTIERRELPDSGWTRVGELLREPTREAPALTYDDETVSPRRRYEYRVTQRASSEERPDAKPVALTPFPVSWTAPLPVPSDLVVVPVRDSVIAPSPAAARRGAGPVVSLRVFKRDGATGWVEKQYFQVRAGSRVGRVEKLAGREVDFGGVELLDARFERRRVLGVERRVDTIRFRWLDTGEVEEVDDLATPPR